MQHGTTQWPGRYTGDDGLRGLWLDVAGMILGWSFEEPVPTFRWKLQADLAVV
jgi:hypothetical protein